MNSFMGKMLVVDLSSGKIETKTIPNQWAEMYGGQKGMGTRILMDEFDPLVDPLSPDNKIVLTASVMAGTIISCSAKLAVTTKSPLTGTITDGSMGGHIGAELKYAGYDAICIKGKAATLSYLYLDPDKAEIRPVSELKGMGTFETEKKIKEMVKDDTVKVMAIGPAGENLVRYSCISTERYRQLGRGGIGAVMGSKNLKAVAIKGWLDVQVPDIKKCMELAKEIHQQDGIVSPEYQIYTDGTPMLVDFSQASGLLPTANFQEGTYDDFEKINSASMKSIRIAKKACFSCAIACGNYLKGKTSEVEGPEYETIALCGSSIMNNDKEKIVEMNSICDDFGLDTISAGAVIAYMMEATEKGLHDFGIRFGETDKAIEMLSKIAYQQEIGVDAGLGTKALADKYGGSDYAIQVKGLELPGYDPRGSWAMGIAYVSAPRGGCHMSAYPIEAEAWGDLDPFTYEGKSKLVVGLQNTQFAKFSMGVCDFWPISAETLAKAYEVTYGGSWTAEQVVEMGERVFNLQRIFNVMAGFDADSDLLPDRFYNEQLKAGPPKGISMTKEAHKHAMAAYYTLRDWDSKGKPRLEKLKILGFEEKFIDSYRDYLES
ncbi:aldehyde ferredoxin oxidoreductase family protein [bacterium]|nr:aldehyde ferredoxin oxidoreductase family protein [bacterium]